MASPAAFGEGWVQAGETPSQTTLPLQRCITSQSAECVGPPAKLEASGLLSLGRGAAQAVAFRLLLAGSAEAGWAGEGLRHPSLGECTWAHSNAQATNPRRGPRINLDPNPNPGPYSSCRQGKGRRRARRRWASPGHQALVNSQLRMASLCCSHCLHSFTPNSGGATVSQM